LRWRHVGPPQGDSLFDRLASTAAGCGDTETGGSIHIWHFFPNMDKYVEALKEMADVVGVDHVSIGTDQQVVPGSADYSQWVQHRGRPRRGIGWAGS
jgi:hypothetical protein